MVGKLINGIKGVHIASGIPVDIPFNSKQMQLALDKSDKQNDSWDMAVSYTHLTLPTKA